MAVDPERKAAIAERLNEISYELTDLAVENLKDAVRDGDETAKAEEKQIARARRSVDKAAGILQGLG